MKRKKFVKTLMANGFSRNLANQVADHKPRKYSYAKYTLSTYAWPYQKGAVYAWGDYPMLAANDAAKLFFCGGEAAKEEERIRRANAGIYPLDLWNRACAPRRPGERTCFVCP